MTKKILSLILALVISTAALVSCGESDAEETVGGTYNDSAASTADDLSDNTDSSAETELDMYVPGHDENADVSSVYTANYAFSNAHLAYILQSSYQNLIYNIQAYYNGDFDSFGLDVSKSLKDQVCGIDESAGTWFDYFAEDAVAAASEVLVICEAANAAGYTLPDEAQAEIDTMLDNIQSYADEADMTIDEYVEKNLGPDVTVDIINHAMTLSYLAQYYISDCIDNLDLSDDVLEAKYQEDPDSADSVDYLLFTLDHSELIPEDADEAAVEEALNACRAAASNIANAADEEGFKAAVKSCLIDTFGYTEEDAELEVETLAYEGVLYSDDPVLDWAFDAETGDNGVIEVEEYGVVYACRLTARNGRDENVTNRNVRHILFTHDSYEDDIEVRKVYDEWVAGGASVEDFIALAAEYSEDPGSADAGGLYEDVYEGQMVDEFNDWLFDESRAEGDHAIVESEQFGWHIMYYEGGEPAWKEAVKSYIQNETQTKIVEDAMAAYAVTVDEEVISGMPA